MKQSHHSIHQCLQKHLDLFYKYHESSSCKCWWLIQFCRWIMLDTIRLKKKNPTFFFKKKAQRKASWYNEKKNSVWVREICSFYSWLPDKRKSIIRRSVKGEIGFLFHMFIQHLYLSATVYITLVKGGFKKLIRLGLTTQIYSLLAMWPWASY